ncbi:MAG: hypothetical protein ACYTJ0_17420 [Planctomycetota bacterium]|jgi:hypothetical protein
MIRPERLLLAVAATLLLTLIGCSRDHDPPGGPPPGDAAAPAADDDRGHSDSGDADDGDHHEDPAGDVDDHDVGAASRSIGSVEIGGSLFEVTLPAEVETGGEMHFDMVHLDGPVPAAVRAWVGDASGVGAMKSRVDGRDGHYHGHAEVPAELGEEVALWIEVQAEDGSRTAVSLPLS